MLYGKKLRINIGLNLGFGKRGGILTYLLNALGIASTGTATYTGPTSHWLPDWEGTLTDMGGLVDGDGNDIPAIEGCRVDTGVVYDDDGSGNPLHPSTGGSPTEYLFYDAWEASAIATAGDFVQGLCSDGIRRWFTCTSTGATGLTEPTWPADNTPVTDNTAEWTGAATNYHTLKGMVSEPAATNLLLNSDSLSLARKLGSRRVSQRLKQPRLI